MKPTMELIWTMRPAFRARIEGRTARLIRVAPRKLVSMMAAARASGVSLERSERGIARVVDEQVDPAGLCEDVLDESPAARLVAYVERLERGIGAAGAEDAVARGNGPRSPSRSRTMPP